MRQFETAQRLRRHDPISCIFVGRQPFAAATPGLLLQAIAVLTVLFSCLLANTARADASETLEQAITAYTQAQEQPRREDRIAGFQTAERLFQHAVTQGAHSADLYTDLGNAALQSERLGSAILAYRRALALDPNHPRAQQNLRHARTLLPAWVPRPEQQGALESFFFWRSILSPAEQAGIAAISFLMAALLLAVSIRWRSTLARLLAVMPLLVWLGLLVSVAIEARGKQSGQAVLTADETIARTADSANAQIRFGEPLPGGTEVDIRESRESWVHIVLANGRDAWVPSGAVEAVSEAEHSR